VSLALYRSSQKENATGVIDQQIVLDCMHFGFATVKQTLHLWIKRPRDGTFCPIMEEKVLVLHLCSQISHCASRYFAQRG